ncbi:MAG: molybdopterin molybdotransferase MoeA [Haloarculaceae archaeon]
MAHNHDDMMWRTDAVESVLALRRAALAEQPTEAVTLDRVAERVLAEDIVADQDVPAHDHATMDGYAFDATDDYPLTVVDSEVYPEDEPPSIGDGEAVEIATGASLPPEANAVLKREESEVDGDQLSGVDIDPGTYTYERGSNVTAGERLFEQGTRLSAKDTILLGDLGKEAVDVVERFTAGILATGTEIHEGRQQDLDSDMLANLVRSWGHDASYEGSVPDEYDRVKSVIEDVAEQYDVVLTTGGTSVGHKDHVIRALDDLGQVHFHRVRIRPGKPIAAATLEDADATVFAIPGKPLGAYTISTFVMRPFFTGRTDLPSVDATLTHDVELGLDGFEYMIPVTLSDGEATPMGHVASPLEVYEREFDASVISSSTRATRADGAVVTQSALSAQETVSVVPYPALE